MLTGIKNNDRYNRFCLLCSYQNFNNSYDHSQIPSSPFIFLFASIILKQDLFLAGIMRILLLYHIKTRNFFFQHSHKKEIFIFLWIEISWQFAYVFDARMHTLMKWSDLSAFWVENTFKLIGGKHKVHSQTKPFIDFTN